MKAGFCQTGVVSEIPSAQETRKDIKGHSTFLCLTAGCHLDPLHLSSGGVVFYIKKPRPTGSVRGISAATKLHLVDIRPTFRIGADESTVFELNFLEYVGFVVCFASVP